MHQEVLIWIREWQKKRCKRTSKVGDRRSIAPYEHDIASKSMLAERVNSISDEGPVIGARLVRPCIGDVKETRTLVAMFPSHDLRLIEPIEHVPCPTAIETRHRGTRAHDAK